MVEVEYAGASCYRHVLLLVFFYFWFSYQDISAVVRKKRGGESDSLGAALPLRCKACASKRFTRWSSFPLCLCRSCVGCESSPSYELFTFWTVSSHSWKMSDKLESLYWSWRISSPQFWSNATIIFVKSWSNLVVSVLPFWSLDRPPAALFLIRALCMKLKSNSDEGVANAPLCWWPL